MGKFDWSVLHAKPREDYTIELEFFDGKHGVFDVKPLLNEPLFAPLNTLAFFMTAHADHGTVIWNDEVDIAPEILYEECM